MFRVQGYGKPTRYGRGLSFVLFCSRPFASAVGGLPKSCLPKDARKATWKTSCYCKVDAFYSRLCSGLST